MEPGKGPRADHLEDEFAQVSAEQELGAELRVPYENTGMPTKTKDMGQETGTAKDSAGTGQMREESKKEQKKQ